MKNYCLIILIFLAFYTGAQAQKIQLLQQDTATSIRGLSVVDHKIAWASGSKGRIAITTNGGKTWNWQQVKGFEKSDFRDIEAFSAREAIIMSSGTPALILKTMDAGISWKVVYRNDDKAYFLDAMDFTDAKNGFVLGDPINQKFLLLKTNDYGNSWTVMPNLPPALLGEAAFAASGTCLRANHGVIQIVTGGIVARLITKKLDKEVWKVIELPLKHGQQSQGAFSVSGNDNPVIVGGDYVKNKEPDSAAVFSDANRLAPNFQLSKAGPAGFQSCVIQLGQQIYLATGTSGSNISADGGKTWQQISVISFNVCQKARHGNAVFLAGDQGKITKFINH